MKKYKAIQKYIEDLEKGFIEQGLDEDTNNYEFYQVGILRVLTDLTEKINKNTIVIYVLSAIIVVSTIILFVKK